MTASVTDASTRSVSTQRRVARRLRRAPRARRRSGTPRRSATARHEGPETVCARIFVRRPAPKRSASSRGYRCDVTASAEHGVAEERQPRVGVDCAARSTRRA